MQEHTYRIAQAQDISTPALVYYRDTIVENTQKAIDMAGGAARLWPHIKTHKMRDMVLLLMGMGIERFKCATIAEAEMLAEANAPHILLAYPLIGPNIGRYLSLIEAYPACRFYAIGDDSAQIGLLSDAAAARSMRVPVLLDINMGMDRTGVIYPRAQAVYKRCASYTGIIMAGLHCYDGHHTSPDAGERQRCVEDAVARIARIQQTLVEEGLPCGIIIAGGTPSFPFHAKQREWYASPGTIFINDWSYYSNIRDLDFLPGAALLTRVVSHPDEGLFTLDLGSKGIATDPPGKRGVIVGMEDAVPVRQSEEHWVFRMPEGALSDAPPIGTMLYVIPTHICPTTALYPSVLVAESGRITGEWIVTARNRRITY